MDDRVKGERSAFAMGKTAGACCVAGLSIAAHAWSPTPTHWPAWAQWATAAGFVALWIWAEIRKP